jgi:hypothetical protein
MAKTAVVAELLTVSHRSVQDGTGGYKVSEIVLDKAEGRTVVARSLHWPTAEDDQRLQRIVMAANIHETLVSALCMALAALDDPRKETAARHVIENALAQVKGA